MERLPKTAASGPLADYAIGSRVMTVEGFPGKIDDIHEGPGDLTTYFVTLDNNMGGGEYAEAEIQPMNQSQAQRIDASVEHTAADDYPELGSILTDRLPPEITRRTASKTAEDQQHCTCGALDYEGCFCNLTPAEWAEDRRARNYPASGRPTASKTATSDEARDWGSTAREDLEPGETFEDPPYADEVASHLALYLPPVPKSEQRASTTDIPESQRAGYQEGFSHGQEGITRNPSQPEDEDFRVGYDLGWSEGVTVHREPANSWDIDDLGKDQTADVPRGVLPANYGPGTYSSKTAGGFTDLLRGDPQPNEGWGGVGRVYSYDWCRFRRESHCWLPKGLNVEASRLAGYAVWVPEDRGNCHRVKWTDQQKCPTGEPGPNSGQGGFTDATVPWEDGGQREGVPGSEIADPAKYASLRLHGAMEFTAAWRDIQQKAKRIRSEGGVRMVAVNDNVMVAHVKGDHGVYETEIVSLPGKRNVAAWHCGCKWSSYSWGRSGPWKRFEGRMCSHALALSYEAQSRGAHGREITLDEKQPAWMDQKHVHRPGDYDKDKKKYSSAAPAMHPVYDFEGDDSVPTTMLAHAMLAEGQTYQSVREMLLSSGVESPAQVVASVRRQAFKARINGEFFDIDFDGDGFYDGSGHPVDPTTIVYPKWHPTMGLDPNEEKVLVEAAKDTRVPPSEHGDPRMQDKGVSVSKTKDGKYYVHTHRARGKYRDSVADIPDSEIKEIRATGAVYDPASDLRLAEVMADLAIARDQNASPLDRIGHYNRAINGVSKVRAYGTGENDQELKQFASDLSRERDEALAKIGAVVPPFVREAARHTVTTGDYAGISFDYDRAYRGKRNGQEYLMVREPTSITARTTEGRTAGYLTVVESTNEIGAVNVIPDHQRQGIATEMLEMAREQFPGLAHTSVPGQLSPNGEAWSKVVGSKTAARMDTGLIRSIFAAKPWLDSKTADVVAGRIKGLEIDPHISPGLAGHAYNADKIVLSPAWETDSEFGRFLLLTHEIGHSVPVDRVQAHPDFAEVFGKHVSGGRYEIGNPWGANEFLSEVIADGYSTICLLGEKGWYEDQDYVGARGLRIINQVAREAGMPHGKADQGGTLRQGSKTADKYDPIVRSITLDGQEFVLTFDPLRSPWWRSIKATANGAEAGYLTWGFDNKVCDIGVQKRWQRRGLATAMWTFAKEEVAPDLQHSHALLPDGEAWMKSLGAHEASLTIQHKDEGDLEDDGQAMRVYVAYDGGKAIGVLSVSLEGVLDFGDDEEQAIVGVSWVEPEHRRQGVLRSLLEQAKRDFPTRTFYADPVQTDAGAAFNQSAGLPSLHPRERHSDAEAEQQGRGLLRNFGSKTAALRWGVPATGGEAQMHPGSYIYGWPYAALWYSIGNMADPQGVTIHAVFVDENRRREGWATQLLDLMAREFQGHAVDPGGLTPEGALLWDRWCRDNDWPEVNGIIWLEDESEVNDYEASLRTAAKHPPARLYHFTSEMHLPRILQAGHLRLTESNISFTGEGPPVVWLTSTPEPDGNGLAGSSVDKGAVRITVTPPPETYWWPEWSREQGIEEFWYNALERASGGSPDNWWVSTKEITFAHIERIEVRGQAIDFKKTSAAEEPMVEVTQKDHLWTWRCLKCEETQPGRGYRDETNTRENAEAHAMWCYDLDWGDTVIVKQAMPVGPMPEGITFDSGPAISPYGDLLSGIHEVSAHLNGKRIGYLQWLTRVNPNAGVSIGVITRVGVDGEHHRRGIATELLRRAREIEPRVHHSVHLTEEGEAWSQAVSSKTAMPRDDAFLETLRWSHGPLAVPYVAKQHMVRCKTPDGTLIGHMRWLAKDYKKPPGKKGEITYVFVSPEYQRRGVATEMLRKARSVDPDVHHSGVLTEDGASWSQVAASLTKTASRSLFHLTDKADFRLDPKKSPDNNTTMGETLKPGIFLAPSAEAWANGYGYWRPWVVEFSVPEGVGMERGYGGEVFVLAEDYDKVSITRVMALDAYAREKFQDWGWTETEFGTEFDTEQPLPPGNWHMTPFDRFPYQGYRAQDIRSSDPSWQSRYKARVKKYQRGHGGVYASRAAASLHTTAAGEQWLINGKPYRDGVWIEVEPDIWYRGADLSANEIPSRLIVRRGGDRWAWSAQVLTFIGAPHEDTGWQKPGNPSGTAKTLEQAKEKALASLAKDHEFFRRYDERQRANLSETFSVLKTADEDQCPHCAGDSLVQNGQYVCESGHTWHPDNPEAQAYHGDGPNQGVLQPIKEGMKMDIADEFGSLFDGATEGISASANQQREVLAEWGLEQPLATLHDEPEPALPFTDGSDEDDADKVAARLAQTFAVGATVPQGMATASANSRLYTEAEVRAMMARAAAQPYQVPPMHPSTLQALQAHEAAQQSPTAPLPGESEEERGKRLLAYVDASLRGEEVAGPNPFSHLVAGQADNEIASHAANFLATKQALKSYSPIERQAIIDEGEDVKAGNLDRLDIKGTHYEALEAHASVPEDEDMTFLDGDPNLMD